MSVFYGAFILVGLSGMFLLGGNQVVCGFLLGAAAAGLLLRLLAKGKLRRISVLLVPVCAALSLFAGQTAAEGGMGDYAERIRQAAALIDKENMDEGMRLLDELEAEFGATDLSCYERAEIHLYLGEYDEALSCVGNVKDKSHEYWYEYMERILRLQGTDEALARLEKLYLSGAEDLPDSSYMQYMAGLVRLGNGAGQSAAYYFRRARELDPKDALSCYYLGVICYEQGNREEASAYFAEALERGVDEERAENIQWYME